VDKLALISVNFGIIEIIAESFVFLNRELVIVTKKYYFAENQWYFIAVDSFCLTVI